MVKVLLKALVTPVVKSGVIPPVKGRFWIPLNRPLKAPGLVFVEPPNKPD